MEARLCRVVQVIHARPTERPARTARQGVVPVSCLCVGNLPFQLAAVDRRTAADLRSAVAAYGEISSSDVVTGRWKGASPGFGLDRRNEGAARGEEPHGWAVLTGRERW